MEWTGEVVTQGVRERSFVENGSGRPVPGLVWTPAAPAGPCPLVLVGHGAAGSKREAYVVALARRLARREQMAVAAIDGPVHGERRSDGDTGTLAFLEFSQAWSSDPQMTDAMVADWRATLDALGEVEGIRPGPAGYWGLSMGTILGLPLVAADERIGVAVLGLMGMTGPTRERIAQDAPQVRCPVLFLLQWDDELFSRRASLELFDALGSPDKRLHGHPGRHGEVPAEAFGASAAFLARHLRGGEDLAGSS